MLHAIGDLFTRISARVTPNPFAFALLLTLVVAVVGVLLTDNGFLEMATFWYRGFWDLLSFAMQIVIILISGHVLATSPPARRVITKLSDLPKTAGQAILLIAFVTSIAGFMNWGIGLVTGAVMAVTVSSSGRARGIRIHYPLAAAAGYMGLLIFGNGFSSSAPLLVNTDGHFLIDEIGLVPLDQTILTGFNIATALLFLIVIPLLLRAMHPPPEKCQEVEPDVVDAFAPEAPSVDRTTGPIRSLGDLVDHSRALAMPLAGIGLAVVLWLLVSGTVALDLNSLNFLLVMSGLALYGNPVAYVRAIDRAVHTSSGVILQFPFYAGIMGMMSLSGLVAIFAGGMVSVSTAATLPITAFLSSALVNLFVPSAGGQWAVQGPIIVEAAQALEVPIGTMIMAFAYGDQLTNMIQPFWAVPLLGITSLNARDLLGYTAVAMIAALFIFLFGLTVLPSLFA
ncbi:MAG: TIGR00366 family protein [Gemmatimonadota bacterium]